MAARERQAAVEAGPELGAAWSDFYRLSIDPVQQELLDRIAARPVGGTFTVRDIHQPGESYLVTRLIPHLLSSGVLVRTGEHEPIARGRGRDRQQLRLTVYRRVE